MADKMTDKMTDKELERLKILELHFERNKYMEIMKFRKY